MAVRSAAATAALWAAAREPRTFPRMYPQSLTDRQAWVVPPPYQVSEAAGRTEFGWRVVNESRADWNLWSFDLTKADDEHVLDSDNLEDERAQERMSATGFSTYDMRQLLGPNGAGHLPVYVPAHLEDDCRMLLDMLDSVCMDVVDAVLKTRVVAPLHAGPPPVPNKDDDYDEEETKVAVAKFQILEMDTRRQQNSGYVAAVAAATCVRVLLSLDLSEDRPFSIDKALETVRDEAEDANMSPRLGHHTLLRLHDSWYNGLLRMPDGVTRRLRPPRHTGPTPTQLFRQLARAMNPVWIGNLVGVWGIELHWRLVADDFLLWNKSQGAGEEIRLQPPRPRVLWDPRVCSRAMYHHTAAVRLQVALGSLRERRWSALYELTSCAAIGLLGQQPDREDLRIYKHTIETWEGAIEKYGVSGSLEEGDPWHILTHYLVSVFLYDEREEIDDASEVRFSGTGSDDDATDVAEAILERRLHALPAFRDCDPALRPDTQVRYPDGRMVFAPPVSWFEDTSNSPWDVQKRQIIVQDLTRLVRPPPGGRPRDDPESVVFGRKLVADRLQRQERTRLGLAERRPAPVDDDQTAFLHAVLFPSSASSS